MYDNPWISVSHREVVTPAGTDGIYGLVHFKDKAVGVIPIDDDDHTWLVGQYRYPVDRYSFEIPAGGAASAESPQNAARRELPEECGLLAENLDVLLTCKLSNSVTDQSAVVFSATGLEITASDPDDTEVLAVRRLPVAEAIDMVLRGEIDDALSILGLLRLAVSRGNPADQA